MQQLQIQADMVALYQLLNLSAFVSIVFTAKIYLDSKCIIGIMQMNVNYPLLLFKAHVPSLTDLLVLHYISFSY